MKQQAVNPDTAGSPRAIWLCLRLSLSLSIVTVCGCNPDEHSTNTNGEKHTAAWTITDLRADHGHDTIESDEGGMYHNYFRAVVLNRNGESIHLLYENNLPENLELKLGDRYHINGIADATYSDNWDGYWIHEVQIQRAENQ